MSCCSDRRAAATPGAALRAAAAIAPASPAAAALRYIGSAELALRGPFSGQVYRVGASRRSVEAHRDDRDALMRTGLFADGD